ncbi:GPP34 family phosphoprotein [Microbacterium sp. SLBN-146]|uniref:GOLPH3/VPS74 family protein n=1 Tax=Microbacterium sp. SLBN-146 TaxID=2768457 RepID=UPI00114EB11F|nr:GPP34 family phosphoprotein [Microbacterium sp. SLBN-146]TQJ31071.1 Golgi phosphoprotein 3 GPP34 [Microbacterium sp. SLBN-146]
MSTDHADETTTRVGVADDLLLLLFQPDSGTIAGENTLFYVLAGAVLADLAASGHITTEDGPLGQTRVRVSVDTAPDDEILREAWEYIAEKPRGVQTVLAAIGPELRAPILERLVARGDLRRTKGKVLGFIPTESLEEGDTGRRVDLISGVRSALVDGSIPDSRTAALAALLSASGSLPVFDREIPWTSPVIERAKELERGEWGADAASEAITRTMTAIVVNSVVATSIIATRA